LFWVLFQFERHLPREEHREPSQDHRDHPHDQAWCEPEGRRDLRSPAHAE